MQAGMEPDWTKQAVRAVMLDRRRAQSRLARAWRSRAIARRVRDLSAWRAARVVFLYAPIRGEVDPASLARDAWARGLTVAYPRVAGPGWLAFHRVGVPAALAPGVMGIPEPRADEATLIPVAAADVILVPGVAFSLSGDRLGWGGGYYDALLAARPGAAIAVGLAYAFQIVSGLPREAHDRRVDALVTERGLALPGAGPDHSRRSSTRVPPIKN